MIATKRNVLQTLGLRGQRYPSVQRLERALLSAARAVDHDPEALPIFERIDRELKAARMIEAARKIDSPVERARAMLEGRRNLK